MTEDQQYGFFAVVCVFVLSIIIIFWVYEYAAKQNQIKVVALREQLFAKDGLITVLQSKVTTMDDRAFIQDKTITRLKSYCESYTATLEKAERDNAALKEHCESYEMTLDCAVRNNTILTEQQLDLSIELKKAADHIFVLKTQVTNLLKERLVKEERIDNLNAHVEALTSTNYLLNRIVELQELKTTKLNGEIDALNNITLPGRFTLLKVKS